MRQTQKIAILGVFVAAVVAAALVKPTVGQLSALSGVWLGAAIMGLPTVAVLVATGYRHYGLARSVAVAVPIALITLVVTWVVFVYAFASALSGSVTGPVMTVVIFGVPAVTVVVLGLLALKLVPGHSTADRRHLDSASLHRPGGRT
jgi:hypothetical protein